MRSLRRAGQAVGGGDRRTDYSGTQHLVEDDLDEVLEVGSREEAGRAPWRVDIGASSSPWACRAWADDDVVRGATIGMHHAISDMTTARILARDLVDIVQGKPQRTDAPQPRQLARWQRRSALADTGRRYWNELLRRAPKAALFSRVQVEERPYWYTSVPVGTTDVVGPQDAAALGLVAVMCSVSAVVGESRTVVGLDFSNRWHQGTTDLADCVIQMLPVAAQVSMDDLGADLLASVRRELSAAMGASMFDQSLPGLEVDRDYALGLVGTVGYNYIGEVPRYVWGFEGRVVSGADMSQDPTVSAMTEWHSRHMMVSLAAQDGVWIASLQVSREMMEPDQLEQMVRVLKRCFNDVDHASRRIGDLVTSGTGPC